MGSRKADFSDPVVYLTVATSPSAFPCGRSNAFDADFPTLGNTGPLRATACGCSHDAVMHALGALSTA